MKLDSTGPFSVKVYTLGVQTIFHLKSYIKAHRLHQLHSLVEAETTLARLP